MNYLLIFLFVIFLILLLFTIRNDRLNRQIRAKQKQFGEVNIKVGSDFMTTRNISLVLTSIAVAFVFTNGAPNQGTPGMANGMAESEAYALKSMDEAEMEYSRTMNCIYGVATVIEENQIKFISEDSKEVNYIFSYDDDTVGTELLTQNNVKVGVYVSEVAESYPMQGYAIEIVEECQ